VLVRYPDCRVVCTKAAAVILNQFFDCDISGRSILVDEGDTLSTGKHTMTFVMAPMVHWPEVMMTYDSTDKVLFSADGFGKFGANDVEDPEGWACEARRYYFGIVGKYGLQTQKVLKAAAGLDIQTICPLHGPVLNEDLGYYIGLYDKWSSYTPEEPGVCIAYTSVYGHTKAAAEKLAEMLRAKGQKVAISDLARDDMPEVVEDAFRYDRLVLATTTYNNGIFPFMRTFIEHLTEREYQNRTVAFVENGTWAPCAAKKMKEMFEKSKKITFAETTVTIKSALNEASEAALAQLAEELAK
jgi:flavorubredoxin